MGFTVRLLAAIWLSALVVIALNPWRKSGGSGSSWARGGIGALVLLALYGCATAPPGASPDGAVGLASWYGPRHHGRPTASGGVFDMHALTAAHPTLPLGTRVRVTNLTNNRSVVVRITDRGPYVPGRLIDLSRAAAVEIGMIGDGVTPVRVDVLS